MQVATSLTVSYRQQMSPHFSNVSAGSQTPQGSSFTVSKLVLQAFVQVPLQQVNQPSR